MALGDVTLSYLHVGLFFYVTAFGLLQSSVPSSSFQNSLLKRLPRAYVHSSIKNQSPVSPLQAIKMRVAAAVLINITALCVFSAALAKAQVRGANGPMAAAKVMPVNQREDATRDDPTMNQHLFPILSDNGDSEFESPPARLRRIRRQHHQHRQLQKTESLISWLFESARDYWNFKQESKRDKQENEKDKTR